MGNLIELSGGKRAYLATPGQGAGLGLVVVHEYWGLVAHVQDVCERFAAEGFTAIAPDLFHGATADEPDKAGTLMMALDSEQAASELGVAIDHLEASPSVRGQGVGVLGFSMGGGLALVLATRRSADVRACVTFYGLLPWESGRPDWSRLQAPVQGHVAEQRGLLPAGGVGELEATLSSLDTDVELFVYPDAGPGFFDDSRPDAYDATAAGLAWTRTLEFLRAKLG